mgnify:CR=1 FL=1
MVVFPSARFSGVDVAQVGGPRKDGELFKDRRTVWVFFSAPRARNVWCVVVDYVAA